ncbi:family 20 glycosylhydrolase [Kitasatospora griseola]|uniref:family 20 glycosylhydrolase n=1 Tax=Kitasatospora griseola TaxID=2064 RepID=UPI0038558DDF
MSASAGSDTNGGTSPDAPWKSLAQVGRQTFQPGLPPNAAAHILGAQGCLWTELMPTARQVEYMAFPRLCALAEALWGTAGDYPEFAFRLTKHLRRLTRLNVTPGPSHPPARPWHPGPVGRVRVRAPWDSRAPTARVRQRSVQVLPEIIGRDEFAALIVRTAYPLARQRARHGCPPTKRSARRSSAPVR